MSITMETIKEDLKPYKVRYRLTYPNLDPNEYSDITYQITYQDGLFLDRANELNQKVIDTVRHDHTFELSFSRYKKERVLEVKFTYLNDMGTHLFKPTTAIYDCYLDFIKELSRDHLPLYRVQDVDTRMEWGMVRMNIKYGLSQLVYHDDLTGNTWVDLYNNKGIVQDRKLAGRYITSVYTGYHTEEGKDDEGIRYHATHINVTDPYDIFNLCFNEFIDPIIDFSIVEEDDKTLDTDDIQEDQLYRFDTESTSENYLLNHLILERPQHILVIRLEDCRSDENLRYGYFYIPNMKLAEKIDHEPYTYQIDTDEVHRSVSIDGHVKEAYLVSLANKQELHTYLKLLKKELN